MGITEREAAAEAAELLALRAEVQRLESLRPHPLHRTGHRCACCGREGAPEAETLCMWCREAMEVEAQRDEARAALADARREGAGSMRARAVTWCRSMVVGGCAWTHDQSVAGKALLSAADGIEALPLDAPAPEAP